MILLNSTDSLQVLLAGTVATNQCVLYAAYADMAADGSTFAPGAANGLTNNATAVSWLLSPAADFVRQTKYLSLYNADTASVTATVRINDGTNTRILCKVTLATGERLEYTVDGGFRLVSSSGTGSVAVSDGDKGDITVTASGGTWTVDNDVVTYAKMQNVSATQRVIGRNAADPGDPEEVTLSQLLDWLGTTANDDFPQRKSGAWVNRTVAQVSADLQGTGLITDAVGFRTLPQNSQSTAYTCVAADSGKHILHPSADTTARTMTIPANSSVAFPVGTAITFVNQASAGVMTIAITTDTMRLAGAGTTGSRTLAANGIATALKITSTEWIISGSGLT